ncbi:MAG TPA: iron ABC transporter permease [Gaiellaceae bacterium]|nr:iron ABC transporter permease [Gaiellaceae bacterium]
MTRRPPALLVLTAAAIVGLVALPLAYLVVRVVDGGGRAWDVLFSRGLLELVVDTGVLVVAVTGTALALGVPLAWLTTRTDLPWRGFWATAAALPLVIPSYVAALVFLAAFGPRGLLQRLLEGPFGVERVPEIYGLPGAWLALTVATYPFVFILAAAALRDLDPSLEEAARGLGQSRLTTFRRVTLPVIRPSLAAGALLVALYTLADFGAVSLMQYDSLTRAVYLQYRALFDRTPAAVLALVLVAITAIVLALELQARGRARSQRTGSGAARPAPTVPLGRWTVPSLLFCGAVVGIALVVPLAVLGYWAGRAFTAGESLGWSWEPAFNSVGISVVAAAAAVAASLPVGILADRYPSRVSRFLERLSYAGNALPGIVIALSLVFFAANYATPIYQTLALLVFAYVVRFFPQALAGSHAALARVSPRLEEAGRALGRRPAHVFARVTAPLVTPGLLAGGALVFLSTMKELPATLLLRPIGFETLATEIWRYTSVASYSRAALPALVLIVISAPLVYALRARTASDSGTPG